MADGRTVAGAQPVPQAIDIQQTVGRDGSEGKDSDFAMAQARVSQYKTAGNSHARNLRCDDCASSGDDGEAVFVPERNRYD